MKNVTQKRVELHCHTKYSRKYDSISPRQLFSCADEQGMQAIAFTDYAGVSGYPQIECDYREGKFNARPIYGMELCVAADFETMDVSGQNEKNDTQNVKTYHITILIKNEAGKKALYQLITNSYLNYEDLSSGISFRNLLKNREGLLIGSGDDRGELFEKIMGGADEEEESELAVKYDFLEVMPVTAYFSAIKNYNSGTEDDVLEAIKKMIRLGERLGIPVVATGGVYYPKAADTAACNGLTCDAGLNQEHVDDLHFRTTEEMLQEFSFLSEKKAYEIVVKNTNLIADQCETVALFPKEKVCPAVQGISQSIRERCMAAISRKYEETVRKEVKKRLDWELMEWKRTGGECLLFYIRKLMDQFHLRACDISTRGRWGGSIAVYLMDISEIDPLRYHLSSETVFGREGGKDILPEINIQSDLWEDVMVSVKELEGVGESIGAGSMANGSFRNGKHPGTVLIFPEGYDINNITPLMRLEDKTIVTYFDYHYLIGKLCWFDILTHGMIDRIHQMSEKTGVDMAEVPLDDLEVYELLWKKDGIKQAGGFEQLPEVICCDLQEVISYLKPENVEELARVLALAHEAVYWLELAKKQVAEKTASFETLISCREDVDNTEMYLCPKAHAISDAIMHIRLAWYRNHYPQLDG